MDVLNNNNETHQSSLGLDERPVLSVHLVVETTGVTEIVAVAVTSPQRGRGGATVDTLPAFLQTLAAEFC